MVRLKRRSLRQLRKDLAFLKNIRSSRFGEENNVPKPKKKRNWKKIAALVGGGVLAAGALGAAAHQGYKRDVGGIKTNTDKHIEQIKTQTGLGGRTPAAVGATGEHMASGVFKVNAPASSISNVNLFSEENQEAKAKAAKAAADAQIAAAHAAAEAEKARLAEEAAKAKAERLAAIKAKLKAGSKEVGKASLEEQARQYTTLKDQREAVEKNPALAMVIARQNRERVKAAEVAKAELAEKNQRVISEQKNKKTNWLGKITPESQAEAKAKTDKEVEKTKQETILAQEKINKTTADSYRQMAASKAALKAQKDVDNAKIEAQKAKAQQEIDAQQAKIEAEKQKAAAALEAKKLQLEQKEAAEKAARELKDLQEKAKRDMKEQQLAMKDQAEKAAKELKQQQQDMKDQAAAAKKLNNIKKEITTPPPPASPAAPSALPLSEQEQINLEKGFAAWDFGKRRNVISSSLKKRCKKHHIRLTITRNGKRVPKSEKMLIKQLKK